MNIDHLFEQFKDIKIGVIGDVMLDTYLWGNVERISPEAPVPVVAVESKEYRIGGAGNVALNLSSLGAKTTVLSVTGNDEDAKQLSSMFTNAGINTNYLITSTSRITTNKMRVISRNQQMMRLDTETTAYLQTSEEKLLLEAAIKYIEQENPSVILFEDYNKGVLTETIITTLITLCKQKGILTAVDPKRKNFFAYRYVDIFKPNLKEVKEGLNIVDSAVHKILLDEIHLQLSQKLAHQISFVTLSEHGTYYNDGLVQRIIPSHRRKIADVSGAGDTVIAVAAVVYAITQNVELMAEIANIAGGLVCEEVGTVSIDKTKLLQECKILLSL
jgi:rfaE bifunctional protein kinase chain/domain